MNRNSHRVRRTARGVALSAPTTSVVVRKPSVTHVEVAMIVDCPFSLAVDKTFVLFPTLGIRRSSRTAGFSMRIRIGRIFAHDVVTTFRCQPDLTEVGRRHDELSFECAARSRLVPDFRGSVRFRPASGRTAIVLDGSYVPRFGPAGRVFDAIVGRRFANDIATDVMRRLAEALERHWHDALLTFLTENRARTVPYDHPRRN